MAARAGAPATAARLAAAVFVVAPLAACSTVAAGPLGPDTASWDGATTSAAGSQALEAGTSDVLLDASACRPAEVQTLVPEAYHEAEKVSNACSMVPDGGTLALWQIFYRDCFDASSKTTESCDKDNSDYAACYACILTSDTASRYGPLLTDSTGWVRPNVAGCIELSDSSPAALACARSVQALQDCELAACEANCPVTGYDTSSTSPYAECASQADSMGCEPFVSPASCAEADGGNALDAGDAAAAFACQAESMSFEQFYDLAVPLFCASAAPAGDGAAPDAAAPEADAGSSSTGSPGSGADAGTD